MRKRLTVTSLLVSIIILLSGCSLQSRNISTQPADFPSSHPKEKYASPYTACFENKDGTYSLYIFSSPIQYRGHDGQYHTIDHSIVRSSNESFDYENKENNIKTYFSPYTIEIRNPADNIRYQISLNDRKKFKMDLLQKYVTCYGDSVNAVAYETKNVSYIFYPVNTGIKCEVIIKEKSTTANLGFTLQGDFDFYINNENEYVTFQKGGEIKSVFYYPLIALNHGLNADLSGDVDIKESDNGCKVSLQVPANVLKQTKNDPIKLDMSFVLYHSNMPDVGINSEMDHNSYLGQKAFIGNHHDLGEGMYLSRLRLNYYMTIKPEQIINASLNIKALQNPSYFLGSYLYTVEGQWSSTQLLWEQKPAFGQQIGTAPRLLKNGYLNFDICDYVKSCFNDPDGTRESKGFALTGNKQTNSYGFIATSDNTAYPSFMKIDMKKPPAYFKQRDAMNEQMY